MEGTDNKETKTKRDSFRERLRAKYPEQNFDDEEDFFSRVNDDYDEYENTIAAHKKQDDELSNMFTADPRSASFLMNWRSGQDPAVQLVRSYGTEIKDVIDDPARQDEIAEANAEYVKRVAEEKELEEAYKSNLTESLSALETMQGEQGLSDEQVDAAMELLATISKDFIVGKITPETIRLMFNAINHDTDVQTASEDGEVRGRNAHIDEKLKKRKTGDGTPSLSGKNGNSAPVRKRANYGALDNFSDGTKSIWERGGEKRHK